MNEAVVIDEMEEIKALADRALDLPQVECPLRHSFSPGVYMREMFAPAGTFIIGNEHLTEHFNVILAGRLRLKMNGKVKELSAPYSFISKAGTMKMAYVIEDLHFMTIHPTDETDVDKLETLLFRKTEKRQQFEAEQKRKALTI